MRKLIILYVLLFCNFSFAKTKDISILHFDVSEKKVVYSQHEDKVRSIASITKLMTAMVSLDHSMDMSKELKLSRNAKSNLPLRKYTRKELFEAMLIRSDNGAAETLASDYPGGRQQFIRAMNKKASDLGMYSTHFDDPTGLSINNKSTANQLVDMVITASNYPLIKEISVKKLTQIETKHKKKIRKIVLNNTNRLVLFEFDNVIVSKTGFTTPAGFCVALMAEQKEKKVDGNIKHRHVIIVLGAKNTKERVDKVKEIMYNNIIDTET